MLYSNVWNEKTTFLHKTLAKVNENRKSMKTSTRHTESVKKESFQNLLNECSHYIKLNSLTNFSFKTGHLILLLVICGKTELISETTFFIKDRGNFNHERLVPETESLTLLL